MPRTKSAKKAERASLTKRAHNLVQAARLDKLVRVFKRTETPTADQVSDLKQALDKAAKTGLIHHGKADRLKSRLTKQRATVTAVTKSKTKAKVTKRTPKKKTR